MEAVPGDLRGVVGGGEHSGGRVGRLDGPGEAGGSGAGSSGGAVQADLHITCLGFGEWQRRQRIGTANTAVAANHQ